jgi:multidrug resistance protein MdtO
MMGNAAEYLRMANVTDNIAELRQHADAVRDQIGKTVGGIRTMSETVEYEFGVDVKQHLLSSEMILNASLTLVAFFWNQFAVLHREEDFNYLTQPELTVMRSKMADGMDKMAKATVNKTEFVIIEPTTLADPSLLADPVYGEFARNAVDRYCELEQVVARLRTLA